MATDNSRYPERTHNFRILCLDDEEAVLKSLRRLLKNTHYEVLCYTSAKEALGYIEQQEVDLIISDMRMPEMSGDQFLAKAAEISPNTVRLLLTGFADLDSTIHAINEGKIHRYMQKPWENDELTTVIAAELALKQREDERKRYERMIKNLATTDSLTGLLNRDGFFDQLNTQAEYGASTAGMAPSYLVLADIDGFKALNDELGAQTGDDILKLVGRMLSCNLRSGDLIARIVDDEFAFIINQYSKEDCIDSVANRMLKRLSERTFLVRNNPIDLTVSIGMTRIHPSDSADQLYRLASKALDTAINEGGDNYEIEI